ncbi:hypothetical protein MRQ36_25200 [Micromonospora sp. R77]|uniref:hypothetical protein n=1 Tax=Micromonospora sp. R77 TaxID=2925836 RepID=UPI001F623305|nr:hypothetical protein [Micromonospora sp. R77]MCI4065674.1 hypothetical protein [Micromonospora sp. R77]
MRAVALLLAVGVTVGVAVGCHLLLTALVGRRGRRAARAARWQVLHYGRDGRTVVAVGLVTPRGRVLDEHVVDHLPDGDPEWNDRFLRARENAEERAYHLNGGGTHLPG